ncbi:MAG: hypothetical protein WC373_14100 [Smithella sp.]|jgi:hypothetical protein
MIGVLGKKWILIVTIDDAINEYHSMFFLHEEGTASSFQGVEMLFFKKGLSLVYTDQGSR